ncbi:MAG: hypothetical protein ACREML_01660, partial [Vulcanimicrobiaceae bacterium]
MADLKPLNLNGSPQSEPSKTTTAPADATPVDHTTETTERTGADDIVDQWIAEHPETEEAPSTTTTTAAETTPIGEKPAAAPATTTETTTTAVAPQTTEQKPATQPVQLDKSEKIKLTDDAEWTREQIVTGLRERKVAQDELTHYRGYFGDPEFVKKNWLPLLQRFKAEPQKLTFVDAYLTNPDKAAYLDTCAKHFDENAGAPTTVEGSESERQRYAQLSPEDRQMITELRAHRETSEREAGVSRFNTEMSQCTSRFTILAQDENLRKILCSRAEALYRRDQRFGLLHALDEMAPTLEALTIARKAQSEAPAPTDTPALV